MKTIQEIALDLCYESDKLKTIRVVQSDYNSKYLKIYITDQGRRIWVKQDCATVLNVKNSENVAKMYSGSVNTDGTISVLIPVWVLQTTGLYTCNVSIEGNGEKISTEEYFYIEVSASPCTNENIMADPNYDVLTKLTAEMSQKVEEVENLLSELSEKQNELTMEDADEYEFATKEEIPAGYVFLHDEDGDPKKITVSDLLDGGCI